MIYADDLADFSRLNALQLVFRGQAPGGWRLL